VAGAGGWIRVDANGPWGRATADALASRVGIGNARSWRAPKAGQRRVDVETFPLGCWPTEALRSAGGWDERFLRNQDYELNYRLRKRGGRIVFDPEIWSYYRPRESWRALARQYWNYGRFKALTLVTSPGSLRPRQLAPAALLATTAAAVIPTRAAPAARLALAAYASVVASTALRSRSGWRTGVVLVTIHGAWGAGLLAGLGQVAARACPPPGGRVRRLSRP
jgi:hypothetical protein